jgi:hypothetical protein
MTRNDLIVGPAKVTFNGATFFTQGDIAVALDQETFNIETSPHGKIDERYIDIKAEATMTPAGQWNAAFISAVWEYYTNMVAGASIFGAADKPLVIKGTDTAKGTHTLIAAAPTKLPDIILSATKTMIGSMSFTGIRGLIGTTWSVADALYTVAASDGNIVDATFDAPDIITQPYTGIWTGITGFTTAIETETGWTISFDLQTEARQVDSLGTIDMKFKSINIMAKCVPIQPTADQILAALKVQGAGAVRGRSAAAGAAALTITGADTVAYCTIPLASLKSGGFRFGSTVLRNNEIGFIGARPFASGVQSALFSLLPDS